MLHMSGGKVPESGSGAAESWASHGAEASRGHCEVDGGRRCEGAGWGGNMGEIRHMERGEVVDGLNMHAEIF